MKDSYEAISFLLYPTHLNLPEPVSAQDRKHHRQNPNTTTPSRSRSLSTFRPNHHVHPSILLSKTTPTSQKQNPKGNSTTHPQPTTNNALHHHHHHHHMHAKHLRPNPLPKPHALPLFPSANNNSSSSSQQQQQQRPPPPPRAPPQQRRVAPLPLVPTLETLRRHRAVRCLGAEGESGDSRR